MAAFKMIKNEFITGLLDHNGNRLPKRHHAQSAAYKNAGIAEEVITSTDDSTLTASWLPASCLQVTRYASKTRKFGKVTDHHYV